MSAQSRGIYGRSRRGVTRQHLSDIDRAPPHDVADVMPDGATQANERMSRRRLCKTPSFVSEANEGCAP